MPCSPQSGWDGHRQSTAVLTTCRCPSTFIRTFAARSRCACLKMAGSSAHSWNRCCGAGFKNRSESPGNGDGDCGEPEARGANPTPLRLTSLLPFKVSICGCYVITGSTRWGIEQIRPVEFSAKVLSLRFQERDSERSLCARRSRNGTPGQRLLALFSGLDSPRRNFQMRLQPGFTFLEGGRTPTPTVIY